MAQSTSSNIKISEKRLEAASGPKYLNFPDISEKKLDDKNTNFKKNIFTLHSKRKRCDSIPKLSSVEVDSILNLLDNHIKLSNEDQQLKRCINQMHTSKLYWRKPSTVLKAIKHSILTRKWNNLTHLLLLLIGFPTNSYKPIIRHMCQLIDHYHPLIKDAGLEGQIKTLDQAYRSRQASTHILNRIDRKTDKPSTILNKVLFSSSSEQSNQLTCPESSSIKHIIIKEDPDN